MVVSHQRRSQIARAIAERALGKPLPPGAEIHHHTETALVICESGDYHRLLHERAEGRASSAGWGRALDVETGGPVRSLKYDAERMLSDANGNGWTMQEWAERAGVNRRTVYRVLNGQTASVATGAKLAHALGRKLSYYITPSTP